MTHLNHKLSHFVSYLLSTLLLLSIIIGLLTVSLGLNPNSDLNSISLIIPIIVSLLLGSTIPILSTKIHTKLCKHCLLQTQKKQDDTKSDILKNLSQSLSFNPEKNRIRSEKIESLAHAIQEYNHELRTPIQVILTQAEKLPDTPEIMERKHKIIRAVEKANDIIGTTLRLNGEKDRTENDETIELNALLDHIIQNFHLPSDRFHINQRSDNAAMFLKGNRGDITIIINNILKNACDAMIEGGSISVTSFMTKESIVIDITDTGMGIPTHMINDIWAPFRSRHVTKGRGLGLSIVHRLVKEHSGDIDVSSEVGVGSTFRIKFRPLS